MSNTPTFLLPINHDPGIPVPEPDGNKEYSSDSKHFVRTVVAGVDVFKLEVGDQPVPLTLAELNDVTRDLNILKEYIEVLNSRLKEKPLLAPGTTFYWYRDRVRELKQFFHVPG